MSCFRSLLPTIFTNPSPPPKTPETKHLTHPTRLPNVFRRSPAPRVPASPTNTGKHHNFMNQEGYNRILKPNYGPALKLVRGIGQWLWCPGCLDSMVLNSNTKSSIKPCRVSELGFFRFFFKIRPFVYDDDVAVVWVDNKEGCSGCSTTFSGASLARFARLLIPSIGSGPAIAAGPFANPKLSVNLNALRWWSIFPCFPQINVQTMSTAVF